MKTQSLSGTSFLFTGKMFPEYDSGIGISAKSRIVGGKSIRLARLSGINPTFDEQKIKTDFIR